MIRLVETDVDMGCSVGQSHIYQQLVLVILVEACFVFNFGLNSPEDFFLFCLFPYNTAIPHYILIQQTEAYAVLLSLGALHKLNPSFVVQV